LENKKKVRVRLSTTAMAQQVHRQVGDKHINKCCAQELIGLQGSLFFKNNLPKITLQQ